MNFTAEHKAQFEKLTAKFVFDGETFSGRLGANAQNVQDLLHNTSIKSLESYWRQAKKELAAETDTNPWTSTDQSNNARLQALQDWEQWLNLALGWRLAQAEAAKKAAAIRTKKAQLKELQEASMTPAEKLAALEAEIAALEA